MLLGATVRQLNVRRAALRRVRVGHGSLFQNPTQPNPKFLDPTQPTKVFTRPNPTHHRHLVWHIRLYRKLYATTVTRHRQVHSRGPTLYSAC